MIREIQLEGLMGFVLESTSFKAVCEAMLKSRERSLEHWTRTVQDKYPEGDPFPAVPENFRKEMTMIKMCLGGLS